MRRRKRNPDRKSARGPSFIFRDQTAAGPRLRRWSLGLALLATCLAGSTTQPLWAKKHETPVRTVRGTVVDPADNPLATAVVYLKNLKTLSVRTYITDQEGHYRFSGLDPNVDYEVHAEHRDSTSATHTISSLDDRREIVIILKVRKKKPGQ